VQRTGIIINYQVNSTINLIKIRTLKIGKKPRTPIMTQKQRNQSGLISAKNASVIPVTKMTANTLQ